MWAYLDPTDKHALSMSQWISFIKKAVTYEFRYADVVRVRHAIHVAAHAPNQPWPCARLGPRPPLCLLPISCLPRKTR